MSQPFARLAFTLRAAATTILKNSLRVLASTQELICVGKTARVSSQRDASIYKGYSRVVKVEPTVATRRKTTAQPRREEPVVTAVDVAKVKGKRNKKEKEKGKYLLVGVCGLFAQWW